MNKGTEDVLGGRRTHSAGCCEMMKGVGCVELGEVRFGLALLG